VDTKTTVVSHGSCIGKAGKKCPVYVKKELVGGFNPFEKYYSTLLKMDIFPK